MTVKRPAHAIEEGHRARAGAWIKARRIELGLNQAQLLARLGGGSVATMVSQVEIGRYRIPSSDYARWAGALEIGLGEFARELTRRYDPEMYRLLFSYPD